MANEDTATFIGHSECYGVDASKVRTEIIKLIAQGVTEFYSGGMGSFDWMCARIVYDLKKDYPYIRNYLVIPYLTFTVLEKKYFDSIIYPEGFEKYHFKAAIPARNKYLVDNAGHALCYVTHGWGGAAKTFERAKKKGVKIVTWVIGMYRSKYEFEYPDGKMIELSERIKIIVDDKARYTDWSTCDDIKANLLVDLILLLDEFDYPLVTIDDVYKEVLEQAKNFKKYAN